MMKDGSARTAANGRAQDSIWSAAVTDPTTLELKPAPKMVRGRPIHGDGLTGSQRQWARRNAQGACRSCGLREQAEDSQQCAACLDKHRDEMRERRAVRMAEGRCLDCGGDRDPGSKRCGDCTDKLRAGQVKRYGLTLDDFDAKFEAQSGTCAMCGAALRKHGERENMRGVAHIDHDHATGRVRGLICVSCNHFIGHIEKHNRGELAAAYLAKHSEA